jgi:hypothetical protein
MNTLFEKCAVAGDITKAIDRRGCWSVAITVIGGTESTAVKLQSCETADGVFADYKELIPASEASADQYKGFVLDLYGAGKFIKVVGATMATAVLGDCEADVKKIAITAGEIPSGADLEDNKEVTITENGTVEITPTEGKDGMKKVTATVNVSSGGADEMWYCYSCVNGLENVGYIYFSFDTPPVTETEALRESWFIFGDPLPEITLDSEIFHGDYFRGDNFSSYEKDGNNFTVRIDGESPFFFTRQSLKDITPSKMIALKAYKSENNSLIYANPNDNTKTYILAPTDRQVISNTYTYNSENDTYSDGSAIYSRSSVNDYYSAIDPSHIHDIPNA